MTQAPNTQSAGRQSWMSTLAKAPSQRLEALFPDLPPHSFLRPPEVGAVMVQGRVGGTGAPFNLGEMTVTRCSVQLESGAVGHAVVQGRDKGHAARAAVLDALLQGEGAKEVLATVIAPLQMQAMAQRQKRAEKAAATKVDFFTMVRGEDQ